LRQGLDSLRKANKAMDSNLPPLDFKEDIEKYDAKFQSKEVSFKKCPHTQTELKEGTLRCICGASWSGTNLHKLQELLRSLNTV